VNGRLWPAQNDETLWLPAGAFSIEPAPQQPALRLLDLSADLQSADAGQSGVEFSYSSDARVFALLDREPRALEIDSEPAPAQARQVDGGWQLTLPRGQHLVVVSAGNAQAALRGER
jgi:hypothetical protein